EQERREEEVQGVLTEWVHSIVGLGAEAKGLWLVDFDNGSGYFCWKYGEQDVLFEHTYEEGFSGRKRIEDQ
ncbi:MAG: DUF2203 family protein, partial [Spirochaetia bacterium]|nr:DUF2203 family protein [Spirochaetia bacterium]